MLNTCARSCHRKRLWVRIWLVWSILGVMVAPWSVLAAEASEDQFSAVLIGSEAGQGTQLAVRWTGDPSARLSAWVDLDGTGESLVLDQAMLDGGMELFGVQMARESGLLRRAVKFRFQLVQDGEMHQVWHESVEWMGAPEPPRSPIPVGAEKSESACEWLDGFHVDGLSWHALTSVVFDDGSGPALYVGGFFKTGGRVVLNGIGKWDGVSWAPLGDGVNGVVRALAVYDDGKNRLLVAGGAFAIQGEGHGVMAWDGAVWQPLGTGIGPSVWALGVYDNGNGQKLFAGIAPWQQSSSWGVFQWDGVMWTRLSSLPFGEVFAFATYEDDLIVGGEFTDGVSVLRWDGEIWQPILEDYASVAVLEVADLGEGSVLIAGGSFAISGDPNALNIAKWDGQSWSAIGTGVTGSVSALASYNEGGDTVLVAGGTFSEAGGVAAKRIVLWDGVSWSALDSGMVDNTVHNLVSHDLGSGPQLLASGRFHTIGNVSASSVGQWDGTSWSPLHHDIPGHGLQRFPNTLEVFESDAGSVLVAGGSFTGAGGVPVNHIAQWDGNRWSPLGLGINGFVDALEFFQSDSGPRLVAVGDFTEAGENSVNGAATWDGISWLPLGPKLKGRFQQLETYKNGGRPVLVAGGVFQGTDEGEANYLVQWDGATWSTLGSGVNDVVYDLVTYERGDGPVLIVAGRFTEAGGQLVSGLAKWDGESWSAFESENLGSVYDLEVYSEESGSVLVAAVRNNHDGSSYVARWDGASWSNLGSRIDGDVLRLGLRESNYGSTLVASVYSQMGWESVFELVQWDGTNWSTLSSNMDGGVNSFVTFDTERGPVLVAGGAFQVAGGKPSTYLGMHACPNLTLTLTNSVDEVVAGGTVTYSLSIENNSWVEGNDVPILMEVVEPLESCRWQSVGHGNASGYTSGSGTFLNDTLNLPVDSSVHYVISCTVPESATGTILLEVSSSIPGTANAAFAVDEDVLVERPNASTLILTHPGRMLLHAGVTAADLEAMTTRLHDFAAHTNVDGLMLDLGFNDDLEALYRLWDEDVADGESYPDLANHVLFGCDGSAICGGIQRAGVHDLVRSMLEGWPNIRSIVLVGDDRVVPMARVPNFTDFPREIDYTPLGSFTPDLSDTATTVGQALALNYYLTDDPIGSRRVIEAVQLVRPFWWRIPDLAVGRLVETPSEIQQSLNVFLRQDGHIDLTELDPDHRVLVSGYDFLVDTAQRIGEHWKQSFGLPTDYEALVPLDRDLVGQTWGFSSADEREDALLEHWTGSGAGSYSIISLNGHANHYEEGVPGNNLADIRGLAASEIAALSPELGGEGSLIYAVGCHGGLPVPGSDPAAEDSPLDLPQTYLGRGALGYLANSGFGWGLLHNVGYSEQLVLLFTEALAQPGIVELGDAILQAKQQYRLRSSGFDGTDIKTTLQWTLFGFPMVKIETGIAQGSSAPVHPERGNAVQGSGCPNLPDHLECQAQQNVMSDFGSFDKFRANGEALPAEVEGCPAPAEGDPEGCYYALNGQAAVEGGWPIEPRLVLDSRRPGTSQHGVLWTGGRYEEEMGWVPLLAQPVSSAGPGELSGPLPKTTFIRPRGNGSGNGTNPLQETLTQDCRPSDDELNTLVVAPAELIYDENLEPTRHRLHFGVNLEVFYYNNNATGSGNCDRTGPQIAFGPYHELDGSVLRFSISASDPDYEHEAAAGVWRVVVVWDNQVAQEWQPLELHYDAESGQWVGDLDPPDSIETVVYFVQAVDRRGNVSWVNYVAPDAPSSLGGEEELGEPRLPLAIEAPAPPPGLLFWDGFETGDTSAWSNAI